jgi:hypothetical protein
VDVEIAVAVVALIALVINAVLLAGLADVVRLRVDARSAKGGRKPPPPPRPCLFNQRINSV